MKLFGKHIWQKTDEELMLLVCRKNKEAFSALYDRYAAKLLRFMCRMLNNDEERAQDLLHDLFMKLIEKPELYDTKQRFSPWIYRIAVNMCRNDIRNTTNRLRILKESYIHELGADNSGNILEQRDMEFFGVQYRRLLATLDEEQQLLLGLRFEQEMPVKEIADIMSIPEGTVKSRIFYLLKKLSAQLQEFNPSK